MPLNFQSAESVLDHPDMREAFRVFLTKEFSSENLDFIEAVESFQAATQDPNVSDQALHQRATQINSTYVRQGADRQVNISFENTGQIQTGVDSFAAKSRAEMSTMFNPGTTEVTEMIRRDTLRRFQLDKEFKTTQDGLNKIQQLEAQLEKLKTSKAEQAKAFFQGGSEKVKRELQGQIDETRTRIDQTIYPNGHGQPLVQPQAPTLQVPQVQVQAAPPVAVAQPAPVAVVQPPHQHEELAVEEMSTEEFAGLQQGRTRGAEPRANVQNNAPEVEGPEQEVPEQEVSEGMEVEEMSMEEFATLQQGRSRGVEPRANAQNNAPEQEGPEEEVSEGIEVEEMSMEEAASMQQGRSRAVNASVKPEGPEAPSATKRMSVRESMGKKSDAPSVSEGNHHRM